MCCRKSMLTVSQGGEFTIEYVVRRCAIVPLSLPTSLAGCCCLSRLNLTLIERCSSIPTVGFNMKRVQKGHVTLKW